MTQKQKDDLTATLVLVGTVAGGILLYKWGKGAGIKIGFKDGMKAGIDKGIQIGFDEGVDSVFDHIVSKGSLDMVRKLDGLAPVHYTFTAVKTA